MAAVWLGCLAPLLALAQPVITQQPQSCTNVVGTIATFTVGAAGTAPLAYQWQKDTGIWMDLANCTGTHLCLSNAQTSDAADYRAVVTNVDGFVTSGVAHLTILVPPSLTPTTNLQHQAIHIGTTASFTVTASGTAPLGYRWRLDGAELLGQTSNTLTFSAVQPSDEGDYTVERSGSNRNHLSPSTEYAYMASSRLRACEKLIKHFRPPKMRLNN